MDSASKKSSQAPKKPVNRKAEALRRFLHTHEITQSSVEVCPRVTSILGRAEGGLGAVLSALRFSEDENVQSFLEKYDATPKCDRGRLPWEAFLVAAEVEPTYFLGAAILAIQNHSANTVKLLALSSHPRVMQARIAGAMLPGGHRDRDAIDTGLGFLPSPKGPTFIQNLNINKPAPTLDVPGDEQETEIDHIFPPVGDVQTRLQPIRMKLLDEGK